jgi:hypothetical protein
MRSPLKMNQASVGFDAGTSGAKVVVAWLGYDSPLEPVEQYYVVPPAMRSLNEASYRKLVETMYAFGEDKAKVNSCLLSYIDPGTGKRKYWQMGTKATRPGKIYAQERKFEKSLAKVLAFLGYLVRGEMKTDEAIELNLGFLLPLDEFGDRFVLAKYLREAVSKFEYNGKTIDNIQLAKLDIKPEGYGRYIKSGHDSALVFNWGYSDLTALVFLNGDMMPEKSVTWPLAGMHGFMCSLDFPFTYELIDALVISRAGRKMDTTILKDLTQTKGADEMAALKNAIATARKDFWSERLEDFSKIDLKGLKAVLLSGGTTQYFDVEVNQYFEDKFGSLPDWGEDIADEFIARFDIETESDNVRTESESYYPILFKDIYQYYCTLPGVEHFAFKSVEVVKSC